MELEDRYEFLETIGSGSFATVYRARDLELGREVAIKQVHEQYLNDPESLERYWQEAQLLASLQHPNIVTIYDIYRDRGWLIMELMQTSLAERMQGRQMDLRAVRSTLAHCLRALKYLHARGIVHGDVKLSNLMIDHRRRVKLGDFGLAYRVSDEDGSILKGTTRYMAPEVVSEEFGEIGPQSDLYSVGFCAWELMCGPNFESLFPGLGAFGRNRQIAWMMWHAAADRRLPEVHRVLEGVPDDLALVVQKLCEKDQSRRYRTADEALSDLNVDLKVVREGGAEEDSDGADDEAARRKRLWLAGGAFAASFLLCAVLLFLPDGSSRNAATDSRIRYGTVQAVYADQNRLKVGGLEDGCSLVVSTGQTFEVDARLPAAGEDDAGPPARVDCIAEQSLVEADALKQLQGVAKNLGKVRHAVGMPDLHVGKGYPIGAAVASDDAVMTTNALKVSLVMDPGLCLFARRNVRFGL